jgi:hypothetical protein
LPLQPKAKVDVEAKVNCVVDVEKGVAEASVDVVS